jgi:hypothetical protein
MAIFWTPLPLAFSATFGNRQQLVDDFIEKGLRDLQTVR